MTIAIAGVGLATAQGSSADLREGSPPSIPAPLPWPTEEWVQSRVHRPARGLSPSLRGAERLAALVRQAFEDCFAGAPPSPETPLVLASCNGGPAGADEESWRGAFDLGPALADTPWRGQRLPVASAACASGLHALHLASSQREAGAPEVVVLAADVDSPPSHASFETLRVLEPVPTPPAAAALPPPWHPARQGFVLGEAAVVLRLVRGDQASARAPAISGLALGHDLAGDDGLARCLARLRPRAPRLVLGQGTGPAAVDAAELQAIATHVAPAVPLGGALHHFGHTLGASGLLSVALAALAYRSSLPFALAVPGSRAADGRPLAGEAVSSPETLVVCRALGGASAACVVGTDAEPARAPRHWRAPAAPPALRDPNLRRLAADALARRPPAVPDLLLVRLEAPLVAPADARISGRLLPSSILEMTPGFVAQLLARAWGYAGAAVCLVGDERTEAAVAAIARACRAAGDDVCRIDILGRGEHRHVVWST